jgi:hypothetical protein
MLLAELLLNTVITVPIGNATEALAGIVYVYAVPLSLPNPLPASAKAKLLAEFVTAIGTSL